MTHIFSYISRCLLLRGMILTSHAKGPRFDPDQRHMDWSSLLRLIYTDVSITNWVWSLDENLPQSTVMSVTMLKCQELEYLDAYIRVVTPNQQSGLSDGFAQAVEVEVFITHYSIEPFLGNDYRWKQGLTIGLQFIYYYMYYQVKCAKERQN